MVMTNQAEEPVSGLTPEEQVGQAVRYYRHLRGMSAQDLADGITALGGDLFRQAINKLEVGQRGVTLSELMLLSNALRVSPLSLICPKHLPETPSLILGDQLLKARDVRHWFVTDECAICDGQPPKGMSCNECGAGMPHALAPSAPEPSTPRRRRRLTDELLREVAEVYRAAHKAGLPPTAAVSEHFEVLHTTAARWVTFARKAGIMGASLGPIPGERLQKAA